MKLKRKVMLGIGTGVLAVAALSGAAFAHGGVQGGNGDTFLDKLAAKLGVERSALDEAMSEARGEVKTEALDARLAAAVTAGAITQAEADEIKAWTDARPESAEGLLPGGGMSPGHGHRGPGMGHHGRGHGSGHGRGHGMTVPYGGIGDRLEALVEAGTLTQEEADAIQSWLDSRPDALDDLRGFRPAPNAVPESDDSSESSGTSTAAINA